MRLLLIELRIEQTRIELDLIEVSGANVCARRAIDVDGPARADVGPTHLYQVEFYSCLLDPQLYEQQTQEELVVAAVLH